MSYCPAWTAFTLLIGLSGRVSDGHLSLGHNGQLIPGTRGLTPGPGFEFYSNNLQFADLSGKDLPRARTLHDYNIWRDNFGQTLDLRGAASDTVPEPTTMLLLGLTFVAGCGYPPRSQSVQRRLLNNLHHTS